MSMIIQCDKCKTIIPKKRDACSLVVSDDEFPWDEDKDRYLHLCKTCIVLFHDWFKAKP